MTVRIQASLHCWNLQHKECSGEGVNAPCQCECHESRAQCVELQRRIAELQAHRTELQAANTREVERRRIAERSAGSWRQTVRLWMADILGEEVPADIDEWPLKRVRERLKELRRVRAMSQLVYLAVPYSSPDREVRLARFRAANIAAGILVKRGDIVFSPISHTHPIAEECDLPKGWEFWAAFDRAYLSASRLLVILCIDGWRESVGVNAEREIAKELRLPVEFMLGLGGEVVSG